MQDLAKWKEHFDKWRQLDEDYLERTGTLSNQLIQNFRNNAQKRIVDRENSALLQAKKKKASMKDIKQKLLSKPVVVVAGGAPDPDEEKEFFENLVKNSIREAFVEGFGKFYKDQKTQLWWSKDRAFHGGPHYKVFKEVATGFEWIFNVDMLGNKIIGQHKGLVGRFIPYKNIRFLR